ncbi:MAG: tyrosine-protein phosphatase [Acidimicrobiales bacterium]
MSHDGRVDFSQRLLPLSGAHNFRDLGGYTGSDGRAVSWGRLFRSDGVHLLTAADMATLRSIGMFTVVDLRTAGEVRVTGRGPLGGDPARYHHLPLVPQDRGESVGAPAPAGDDLAERYRWYLETGRAALVEVLRLLARPANLPLVFHCTAGKDRTGVLAALVLDVLGVGRDLIVADYLISAERLELIMGRLRADPATAAQMGRVPASRFSVEASTMERFLDRLYREFGGGRSWALEAGVSQDDLAAMKAGLLEPVRSGDQVVDRGSKDVEPVVEEIITDDQRR